MKHTYPRAIPLAESGQVDLLDMVTHTFDLDKTGDAFALNMAYGDGIIKAVIHLDPEHYHGRTFTVIAENNSPQNLYIQSASLNGKPLEKPWFTFKELTAGGTLRFMMGSKPNSDWGSAKEDRPPSTMPADFKYGPLPPPASD